MPINERFLRHYHNGVEQMRHYTDGVVDWVRGIPVTTEKAASVQLKPTRVVKNLFDPTVPEDGRTKYLKSDGTMASYAGYATSDYIEIKPNTTYVFSDVPLAPVNRSFCWYDETKAYINGQEYSTSTTFTSPNNAKYVRACWVLDTNTPQLEEGSTATPYYPHFAPTTVLPHLKVHGKTEKTIVIDGKRYVVPSDVELVTDITNATSNTNVNTGLYANDNQEMYVRFKAILGSFYILQARSGGTATIYGISGAQSGNTINAYGVTSAISRTSGHVYTVKMTMVNRSVTLYVKDETTGEEDAKTGTAGASPYSFPSPTTIKLFGDASRVDSGVTVYDAYIKVNGSMAWYMCGAKKNNTVGVFDPVSGQFITPTGSLTAGKSTKTVRTSNEFDKTAIKSGYYLNSTGAEISNSKWGISDYMPVVGGEIYYQTINTPGTSPKTCWYDANKTFLSASAQVSGGTLTAPANAAFCRMSVWDTDLDIAMLTPGSTAPSGYIPYTIEVPLTELYGVGDKVVPDEYEQVEHISFDGSSYLDLAPLTTESDIEITFRRENGYSQTNFLFGTNPNSNTSPVVGAWYGSQGLVVQNGSQRQSGSLNTDWHTLKVTSTKTYLDGAEHADAGTRTTFQNLIIGSARDERTAAVDSRCFHGDISRVKVGNTIFVPVKKKATNEYGLYDIVSKQFHGNSGTGTLTGGNVVSPNYAVDIQITKQAAYDAYDEVDNREITFLTEKYTSPPAYDVAYAHALGRYTTSNGWKRLSSGYYLEVAHIGNTWYANLYDSTKTTFIKQWTASDGGHASYTYLSIINNNGTFSLWCYDTGVNLYDYSTTAIEPEYAQYFLPASEKHSVILNHQLHGIGSYANTLDFQTGGLTWNVGMKVLDSTESFAWGNPSVTLKWTGIPDLMLGVAPVSNYFEGVTSFTSGIQILVYNATQFRFRIPGITGIDDAKAIIKAMYDNGTPIVLYYIYATPTTETVTVMPIELTEKAQYSAENANLVKGQTSATYLGV